MKYCSVRKATMSNFPLNMDNFTRKRDLQDNSVEALFLMTLSRTYDLVTYREELDNEISKVI